MNKEGSPHPAIVDKLILKDIYFGSKPPIFKLEQIVELSQEKLALIFFVSYSGDTSLTINTRIQINKVTPISSSYLYYSSLGRSSLSQKPLEMPLDLTIQNIRFEARIKISMSNLPLFLDDLSMLPEQVEKHLQESEVVQQNNAAESNNNKKQLPAHLQQKMSVQFLSYKIPNSPDGHMLQVKTNFDQQLPQVRDTFQDIIEATAKNALKELQNNPLEFTL